MAQNRHSKPAGPAGPARFFWPAFAALFWLPPVIAVSAPKLFGVVPAIAALVGAGWYWHQHRTLPRVPLPFIIVTAFVVLLFSASWFWAIAPDHVLSRVPKLAVHFTAGLTLWAVAAALPRQRRELICRPLPAVLGITAILVIIEVLAGYPFHKLLRGIALEETVRTYVINRGAVIMVTLMWPALLVLVNAGRIKAAVVLASMVIAATFTTNSQSAWAALTAALVAWPVVRYLPRKPFLYGFFAVFSLVCVAIPFLAQGLYATKPQLLVDWKVAAAAQRMEIWNDLAPKALAAPLTGYGPDSTRVMEDIERTKHFYRPELIWHPHNSALQLWIELGLPGLLAGLAFAWLCIRRILHMPKAASAYAFSTFITLLCVSFVGYSLWQGWFLGLFGFSAALVIMTRPTGHAPDPETPDTQAAQ